jgi:hypothetical protein
MKTASLTLIIILSTTFALSMHGNLPPETSAMPPLDTISQETQNLILQYTQTRRRLENLNATQDAQDQRARTQQRSENLQRRLQAAGIVFTG